jgi:hypothetical protein
MSSTRDFVSATLSDATLPLLRRPVEDLIYETLDARQIPNRSDFKELRDLVSNLRGQLTGLTSGVKKLTEAVEEADERDEALTARLEAAETRLDTVESGPSELPTPTPDPQIIDALERLDTLEKRVLNFDNAAQEAVERHLEGAVARRVEAAASRLLDQRLQDHMDALRKAMEMQNRTAIERAAAEQNVRIERLVANVTENRESALITRLQAEISSTFRSLEAQLSAQLMAAESRIAGSTNQTTIEQATQLVADAENRLMGRIQVELRTHEEAIEARLAKASSESSTKVEAQIEGKGTAEGVCSVDGCGKPVRARGLCSRHYQKIARGV